MIGARPGCCFCFCVRLWVQLCFFVHADRCFSFKTNGQTYIQDSILSCYIRLCFIWIVLSFQWILKYRCVRLVSLIVILDLIVLFVFWRNIKFSLCVVYGQYPNILKKKFKKANIQGFKKICFNMDFLNIKIIFLHLEFYNVFVNSKGCWPIFQKYKYLIFGNSSLFTINVWIKKSKIG